MDLVRSRFVSLAFLGALSMLQSHDSVVSQLIARFERGFDTALKTTTGIIILTMLVVLFLGVSTRKLGIAMSWYDEVAAILLAWLTYIGAAQVALHNGHLGMGTLVQRSSGSIRVFLILIRVLLITVLFTILAWHGVQVLLVMSGFHLITVPWMPISVTQSVIPIGSALFIIAEVLCARRQILELNFPFIHEEGIE